MDGRVVAVTLLLAGIAMCRRITHFQLALPCSLDVHFISTERDNLKC